MVEPSRIYVEDYDPSRDGNLVQKVIIPYLSDIFKDLKMRAGKSATGL